jgi:GxxExxY protein
LPAGKPLASAALEVCPRNVSRARDDGRGWDRQEAKDARGLVEPAGEVDAAAASVLQACVEVHRVLGPGFFESIYEPALELDLTSRGVPFVRQPPIAVAYKDRFVGEMRPDFLVAQRLIVELKTVDQLAPVHLAQALSCLKATRLRLALVINFNVPVLLRGVRGVVLLALHLSNPGVPGVLAVSFFPTAPSQLRPNPGPRY